MPEYEVYATITGTRYMGVYEAKTKEEAAERMLKDRATLCHLVNLGVEGIDDAEAKVLKVVKVKV